MEDETGKGVVGKNLQCTRRSIDSNLGPTLPHELLQDAGADASECRP
jgi:hypothetical protein